MVKLEVRTPGKEPFVYELTGFGATIGRSIKNEICLEDPFASRVHAEIKREGDSCWLTDLNSANGTFVNGMRARSSVRIAPGDKLQIGESIIEVQSLTRATLATSATVAGKNLSTGEVLARPETTLVSSERAQPSTSFLSVIEAVRTAAGAKEIPVGVERSRELLAVIGKVGVALLSQSSLDEVLAEIVGLVFEAIPADRAFLLLRDGETGGLVCKAAGYRSRESSEVERAVKISSSITEEVVGRGQPVLASDAQSDERFRQHESIIRGGARSIIAVPLSVNRQVIGMIYVDSLMSINCFAHDDLRLLTTIASVAAIKIENALLLEQRLESERIKQQLASAREIQLRLLPVVPPQVENYDLIGISFPCFEIGGDYFDFVRLENGEIGIALADVSGKGLDAAMLMSCLHASLRAQALARPAVSGIIAAVNRYLYESTPPNKFVTIFYGQLDPQRHLLAYTNAGHNPPVLVRSDGRVECLEAGGIPVGILADAAYNEKQLSFEPGDVLVIYSDGVIESTSERGEEFGVERLLEVIRKNRHLEALKIRDRIEEAISRFAGKARQADDVTLVIVKRSDKSRGI